MERLDEFIKPRKTKSNLEPGTKSSDSEINKISGEDSTPDLQLSSGNSN